MFVSVKERARQIASGQFTAPNTSIPAATLIDLAPEPKSAPAATPKKAGAKDIAKGAAKTKLSKTAPSKDIPKAAPTPAQPPTATPSKATLIGAFPEPTSPVVAPPPDASTPKKSSKSKLRKEPSSKSTKDCSKSAKESSSKSAKEPSSKPSTPKLGSLKSTSSSKPPSSPKAPPSPKVPSPTKTATSRPSLFSRASSASKPASAPSTPTTPTTPSKPKRAKSPPKRSKSPPKRVDSPISDTSSDPLSSLKTSILQQVSGITGLGGRRLAIALKQRSNGEYYVALKDVGSDKYLKMWMNRERTAATKEEALERYLVWVGRMRNEMRWFPVSPRASSPPGSKGKK